MRARARVHARAKGKRVVRVRVHAYNGNYSLINGETRPVWSFAPEWRFLGQSGTPRWYVRLTSVTHNLDERHIEREITTGITSLVLWPLARSRIHARGARRLNDRRHILRDVSRKLEILLFIIISIIIAV